MGNRLQPAFLGGLFIGVLSALPIVSAGNCCCCLWVLLGGGLAAYLRQQNNPYQISPGEGAIVGLMAGVIGAVIGAVVAIPFHMMAGPMQQQAIDRILNQNQDIPPEVRDMVERFATGSSMFIVGLLMSLCVYAVFGTLGGLLGVAIFKKNLPPAPPAGTIDIPPTPYVPPTPVSPISPIEPPPPPPSA
jgi:disulfide bond formation protein DsbB